MTDGDPSEIPHTPYAGFKPARHRMVAAVAKAKKLDAEAVRFVERKGAARLIETVNGFPVFRRHPFELLRDVTGERIRLLVVRWAGEAPQTSENLWIQRRYGAKVQTLLFAGGREMPLDPNAGTVPDGTLLVNHTNVASLPAK